MTRTLANLAANYLDWCAVNTAATTLKCRRGHVANFVDYLDTHLGVTTADTLDKQHLEAWQQHLNRRINRRCAPLTPGSTNNHVKSIIGFLRYLRKRHHIAIDLARHVNYLKEPRLLPTGVLEHAQMRRLLRQVKTDSPMSYRNRTILELLYSCGMRRNELLRLTIHDVDLKNHVLKVHGKGDKQRLVPFGKTAGKYLEGYMNAVRSFWPGSAATTRLFLNCRAGPLRENGLRYIVNCCFAEAPVRVTPHTFRRSCTTELVRGNANLYHVKELLGHENLETLDPYTKLNVRDLQRTHAKCHPREKDDPYQS